MRTLEQVLKAQGMTDQELVDLAPSLKNPRFRASLEKEIAERDTFATQNAKLTADLEGYDKWYMEELTPDYEKVRKEREDAVADAAAAKARLELYQKQGMRRQGQEQDPAAVAEADRVAREAAEATRRAAQPGPQYVEASVFNQAFESTGDAIAQALDISRDHQRMFGTELSMTDLRLAAKAAKMPVKAYWEQQYHVGDKRKEIEAKNKSDHEASIRADQREKDALEFGLGSNPNIRPMGPSGNPFVLRKDATGGKQPWETPANERDQTRLKNAYEKAAKRGEL